MEDDNSRIEKWKQEILDTERSFAKMASEEGIYKAFTYYAADEAVLMRNNKLIIGKPAIMQLYQGKDSKGLSWEPDFVDVATSGDLGYTYGRYTFTYADSSGKTVTDRGVFHTVWKRQEDGSWKYVWD